MNEIVDVIYQILSKDSPGKYLFPITCKKEQNKVELFIWANKLLTLINKSFPFQVCGFLFPRNETMNHVDDKLTYCTIFNCNADGFSMVDDGIRYNFIFYLAIEDPFKYYFEGKKIPISYKIVDIFDSVSEYYLLRMTLMIETRERVSQLVIDLPTSMFDMLVKMRDCFTMLR